MGQDAPTGTNSVNLPKSLHDSGKTRDDNPTFLPNIIQKAKKKRTVPD